jgi:hypothetical protein
VATAITFAGCADSIVDPTADCSIPAMDLVDGGIDRSSIPALINPGVAQQFDPSLLFVSNRDRVIGIMFNDQPLAIPHRVLWWHEVVNLEVPGEAITVTYSPLTGSSLVFNRSGVGVDTFSVSRYVVDSNLVLEDESASLWPQLSRGARCGIRDGADLALVQYQEVNLGGWLSQHPDSWIVHTATEFDFLYSLYPYGDYEQNDSRFLYPVGGLDSRRPAKERVLGIPFGTGGIAVPLPTLAELASADNDLVWAANVGLDGEPIVVFWNTPAEGAVAYRAEANGQSLTFEVRDGERIDLETGSSWVFQGEAVSGPLDGQRLEKIADAHVSFWFAWAKFQPDTEIWSPPETVSSVLGRRGALSWSEAWENAAHQDLEPTTRP